MEIPAAVTQVSFSKVSTCKRKQQKHKFLDKCLNELCLPEVINCTRIYYQVVYICFMFIFVLCLCATEKALVLICNV